MLFSILSLSSNQKMSCFLVLSVFFIPGFAYGDDTIEDSNMSEFIVLSTHTEKHLIDQRVTIMGKFFDSQNNQLNGPITLKVFDLRNPEKAIEIYSNVVYAKNGVFRDVGFIPPEIGVYTVVAESSSEAITSFNIRIDNITSTTSLYVLLVTVIGFIILLTLVSFINSPRIKLSTYHVIRFFLITVIAFGMISFFLFLDVEYGKNSPIGIVVQEHVNAKINSESNPDELVFDGVLKLNWIMHIGGHSADNYSTGLQIPIYVLIGGVFGGYLRFFYYTSNSWLKNEMAVQLTTIQKTYDKITEGEKTLIDEHTIPDKPNLTPTEIKNHKFDEITKRANIGIFEPVLTRVVINRVMSDLALLFIAPVLAIMVYFLLLQGGLDVINDMWTFVLASFTAGIFTENVIRKIAENPLFENKSKDEKKE